MLSYRFFMAGNRNIEGGSSPLQDPANSFYLRRIVSVQTSVGTGSSDAHDGEAVRNFTKKFKLMGTGMGSDDLCKWVSHNVSTDEMCGDGNANAIRTS